MTVKRFLTVLLLLAANLTFAQGVRTVVIDAGHGGKDPGCHWRNTVLEKDIVLDAALILGDMIKERMPDVKVVYTRNTDVFVEVKQRGQIANDAKADLFISIHVNSSEAAEGPSGAETIIMSMDKEDANFRQATRENSVIMYEENYETTYAEYLSGSPEMFIIYSMMQQANIERSISLATAVQRRFKSQTQIPDRGIVRSNPMVLWYAAMPSVLVELGFMNNTHDRNLLTTRTGRMEVAEAVYAGFKEYNDRQIEKDLAKNTPRPDAGQTTAVSRPATSGSAAARPVEKPAATTVQSGDRTLIITDKPRRTNTGDRDAFDYRETSRESARESAPARAAASAPLRNEGAGKGGYAIQILSTARKVPAGSPELKGLKPIERYGSGRYRYYFKRYETRAAADADIARVRETFKDAFITTIQ